MVAAVCGGKRSFFEDIPSSPPLSKRPRCASPTSLPNFAPPQPVLDRLRFVFPHINPQILERAPEECNNDLDSVIKKLNELCSGPAEEKSASVEELGVSADQDQCFNFQIINEILSRNHIPVIVGGTNYYIQALVSPFLLDDSSEDRDESCPSDLLGDEQIDLEPDFASDSAYSYENFKDLDPVAAKRIHQNNHRKVRALTGPGQLRICIGFVMAFSAAVPLNHSSGGHHTGWIPTY
ncbi:hypothetical protein Q3G72_012310 [Acer saccharum]|nr:hypothetical protein Q3G72_012310 [Acer saccharum]